MNIEQVARIAHETNRAYCASIGDYSQPLWEDAPEWQKSSALKGVNFHLDILEKGSLPSPAASHESWLREKKAQGWKYGKEKNPEKKEHPCCVPYDELPPEQRMKDFLFLAIVEAFYAAEAKTTVVR
jgi:hypothetical protein